MNKNETGPELTSQVLRWIADQTGYCIEAKHVRIDPTTTGVMIEPADLVGEKIMKRLAQLEEKGELVLFLKRKPLSGMERVLARFESEMALIINSDKDSYTAAHVNILLQQMAQDMPSLICVQ